MAAAQRSDTTSEGDCPPRTLRVDADPELVGRIAHQAGVPLIELRDADSAGLEEMFLELTADTQRDGNPGHSATHRTVDPQGAVA